MKNIKSDGFIGAESIFTSTCPFYGYGTGIYLKTGYWPFASITTAFIYSGKESIFNKKKCNLIYKYLLF